MSVLPRKSGNGGYVGRGLPAGLAFLRGLCGCGSIHHRDNNKFTWTRSWNCAHLLLFAWCEDLTGISRLGKVLYPIEDTRLLKGPVSGCRLHLDSCDGDKNADALSCVLSVMAAPIIPFHIPGKGSRKPEKVTREQREAWS